VDNPSAVALERTTVTAPPRVLITGFAGCAGSHLSELALSRGAIVYGLDRRAAAFSGVVTYAGDITRKEVVDAVVAETKPDLVFHLAALIPGDPAGVVPNHYIDANITGTYHVLDAVRRLVPAARVLVVSSSAVYGKPVPSEQLISESAPLQPQSLYGVTKAAQDMLAAQFFTEYGLFTIRARTFNQTGPREPETLVCATLARQIARIETGQQEPILRSVTLIPRRDFTDVRDVVSGYWAALTCGLPGQAYNICSGRSVPIQRIAEILVSLSQVRGITVVEMGPPPKPESILNQAGDSTSLRRCSGWQPKIPLETSLGDLLNYCRAQLTAESAP
jgi:GDP-4-dehydro-6-deoxy-D-mannose reductase